jgi:hypothetical protein
MLEPTLYFAGTILGTLVVSILLCRYRAARRKRISFGTVLASAVIANVAIFMSLGFYEEGWHIFTRDAWTGGKGGLEAALVVLGVITIMCILPALGVAVYYDRRSKKDERPVA